MKLTLQEKFWISTYIGLWLIVSTVSTIHSVEFFKLSNGIGLSWSLALAFELGAIASLGGLLISRGNKTLIWSLFIVLTIFQVHCNMYWAWINAKDLSEWIHLLSLIDEDPDIQKRIFTIISGGILPVVALGFMKSLLDYLNPSKLESIEEKPIEKSTKEKPIEKSTKDKKVKSINPFWSNLDPTKTLKVLNVSDKKIEKGTPNSSKK